MAGGHGWYLVCLAHTWERQTMNIQTLCCENHLEDGGNRIMLTQSQSSRCVKTELAQMHIWQSTCKYVKLNCRHIVPPSNITHTAFTLFITHLHRMPEHMQNSRHPSIMTSFLTCTTFTPSHLLLFLLPPIYLLTSLLYCHSSTPFLLVLECVMLKH